MITDAMLETLGDFYTSDYVRINQPWIRQITFETFVNRQLERMKDNEKTSRRNLSAV